MKTVKKISQIFAAVIMGLMLCVSCDLFDIIDPDDPDNPDNPDNSKSMTFIGTIDSEYPCFISWKKGKEPVVEKIDGITLGGGNHPTLSGQLGKYFLVVSNKESVRFDYHKLGTFTGGGVPYIIDLKTLEWTYMPHIKGKKSESLYIGMKDFYPTPDGKKVYYAFTRGYANSKGGFEDNNAQDGIAVYDLASKESKVIEVQGLLDAVGFQPTYKAYGVEKPHGWYITLHCVTPDSKTLIGTIQYHLAHSQFGGWQGGVSKLFRYDVSTNKFDLIVGESEGAPSFISILNDNVSLYFCNYGYGFSHNFKYNLKTRKVTSLSKEYGGMSGLMMKNHIRIGEKGIIQAGGTNNNFYYKDTGSKVEVVEFKNLPYWHQNSLQLNKSGTKAYALITTKSENYYVELQSLEKDAELDTLFTLPSNVTNLMQIW